MAISLRAYFWRFLLRILFKKERLTVEQNRTRSARNAQWLNRVVKGADIENFDLDGLPAAWIRPTGINAEQSKVILHLHGGGYVTGSIDSHLMMCVPMAQTLKRNVIIPNYRLAPEHPFPAALEDALKVYRWLLARGFRPADIVIVGDSAGGGLSLATALALRDNHEPLPAAVMCMSAWADLTHKGKSHITKAGPEVVLQTDVLQKWALHYTNESNLSNPLVSPVYADYHGFPPLLIQVGSEEILLDDSVTLAEKAKADGVDVMLHVWDGMWHVWPALGDLIPESGMAFEEMKEFMDRVAQSVLPDPGFGRNIHD